MVGIWGQGEALVSENGEPGQASRWHWDVKWGVKTRNTGFETEVQIGTKNQMKTALHRTGGLSQTRAAERGPAQGPELSPPPTAREQRGPL